LVWIFFLIWMFQNVKNLPLFNIKDDLLKGYIPRVPIVNINPGKNYIETGMNLGIE